MWDENAKSFTHENRKIQRYLLGFSVFTQNVQFCSKQKFVMEFRPNLLLLNILAALDEVNAIVGTKQLFILLIT